MSDLPDYYQQNVVQRRNEIDLKYKEYSWTDTVASGETESNTIYAPSGTYWDLRQLDLAVSVPSGASSGNHLLVARSDPFSILLVNVQSSYDTKIHYENGTVWGGDIHVLPPSLSTSVLNIQNFILTDEEGLEVYYSNSTDVDQTNERRLQIVVVETKI